MATKIIEINADNFILKEITEGKLSYAPLDSSDTLNVERSASIELTSSGAISFNAELSCFNFDLLTQHFKEDPWYLLHGDCISMLDIFAEDSVDLIVTDPPYRTITGGDKDGKNSKRPQGMLHGNRKLFAHQNNISPQDWMPKLYRVLKPGSHCYIFTNALNMHAMLTASHNAGFSLHNILVWEKNNCTPSQYYMKNCEYVLFLRKGKAKWINNIGDSKTVHKFDNILGSKLHPTEKPVDLLQYYILNSSSPGDLILDPFMGSGSTGEAALKCGRKFVGIEIDNNCFQVAEKRIKQIKEE